MIFSHVLLNIKNLPLRTLSYSWIYKKLVALSVCNKTGELFYLKHIHSIKLLYIFKAVSFVWKRLRIFKQVLSQLCISHLESIQNSIIIVTGITLIFSQPYEVIRWRDVNDTIAQICEQLKVSRKKKLFFLLQNQISVRLRLYN